MRESYLVNYQTPRGKSFNLVSITQQLLFIFLTLQWREVRHKRHCSRNPHVRKVPTSEMGMFPSTKQRASLKLGIIQSSQTFLKLTLCSFCFKFKFVLFTSKISCLMAVWTLKIWSTPRFPSKTVFDCFLGYRFPCSLALRFL